MRESIKREFGEQVPRAIVLDDNANSRAMLSRLMKKKGYEVTAYKSTKEFEEGWCPGLFDVVIADWNLSRKRRDQGDNVLARVREKDWSLPFVLVSGRLNEDEQRTRVLVSLLDSGNAKFVKRGSGLSVVCDHAEDLLEQRDLVVVKLALSLRRAALANESLQTSKGTQSVRAFLAGLVARPNSSHNAGRPLATSRASRATAEKG